VGRRQTAPRPRALRAVLSCLFLGQSVFFWGARLPPLLTCVAQPGVGLTSQRLWPVVLGTQRAGGAWRDHVCSAFFVGALLLPTELVYGSRLFVFLFCPRASSKNTHERLSLHSPSTKDPLGVAFASPVQPACWQLIPLQPASAAWDHWPLVVAGPAACLPRL